MVKEVVLRPRLITLRLDRHKRWDNFDVLSAQKPLQMKVNCSKSMKKTNPERGSL